MIRELCVPAVKSGSIGGVQAVVNTSTGVALGQWQCGFSIFRIYVSLVTRLKLLLIRRTIRIPVSLENGENKNNY